MKKRNLIQIVSLLLCLVLLLAGCKDTTTPPAQEKPDTPVTAEPVRSNFINFNYESAPSYTNAELLCDEYGTLEKSSYGIFIFHKQTKDFYNNITDIYTIFSAEGNKVVKTIENTYPDEYDKYTETDDFGNPVKPPKKLTIDVKMDMDLSDPDYPGVVYIAVTYTAFTPIDDEIIEENELDYSYIPTKSTEFYAVDGTHLATSSMVHTATHVRHNSNYSVLSFGKTNVMFDISDNLPIKSSNGDTDAPLVLYDFTNDKYDYALGTPDNIMQAVQFGMGTGELKVFDKEGNEVLTYNYSKLATFYAANVLQNGDIIVQNFTAVEGFEYDTNILGNKYNVDTFLLDVETGKITSVEFDYLIDNVFFADDELFADEFSNIGFTSNVRNVSIAIKFDKNADVSGMFNMYELVFFDNYLTVNYALKLEDKLHHEMVASIMYEDVRVLKGGYLLVHLDSGVTNRAILKADGSFVTYVPDGAYVTDEFIIIGDEVYDLEMNYVKTFGTNWDNKEDTTRRGTIGDYIIYFTVSTSSDETEYEVNFVNPKKNSSNRNMSDCRLIQNTKDYVLLYDYENEEYVMLNKHLDAVLKFYSNTVPQISKYGDNYFVHYDSNAAIVTVEADEEGGND